MIKKFISLFTRNLSTDLVLADFAKLETKLAHVINHQSAISAEAQRQADALMIKAYSAQSDADRATRVASKVKELLA